MAIKLIKPGERQRKPMKYGEGGREVGGEARRRNMQNAGQEVAKRLAEQYEGIPAPGTHPSKFNAKREHLERSPGARLERIEEQQEGSFDVGPDDTSMVDEMFEQKTEVQRPTRTREDRQRDLEAARLRAGALRPVVTSTEAEDREALRSALERQHGAAVGGAMFAAWESAQAPPVALVTIDETSDTRPVLAAPQAEEAEQPKRKLTVYRGDQEEDLAAFMVLPSVACNSCPITDKCPEFKPGSACAFEDAFGGLPTRDLENTMPVLEQLADMQVKRARRAAFVEMRFGGQLDPNVTRQIEIAAAAVARLDAMKRPAPAPQQQVRNSLTVTGTPSGDAPAAAGGGVLSKLLANFTKSDPVTIEVSQETAATVTTSGEELKL